MTRPQEFLADAGRVFAEHDQIAIELLLLGQQRQQQVGGGCGLTMISDQRFADTGEELTPEGCRRP